MSGITIRDFTLSATSTPPQAARAARDLQGIALGELEALREVDLVAPPEVAVGIEFLVAAFRVRPTSGDDLRLPRLSSFDGPAMLGALRRVLDAEGDGSTDKAARLVRALQAVQETMQHIREQAKVAI